MLKSEELSNKMSCLNRAASSELLFVLLGRDIAAPAAIEAWIGERLRLGLNDRSDEQIVEAQNLADKMRARRGPG